MISNPTPQRALRGHRPARDVPRVRNSADHHAWLVRHLTARDRWLVRMLFEHKVFTTHQIVDLAFPTRRAANLRLLNLHKWGVLHRFQPHRDLGSHPMHYVLDTAGATVLAHEDGIEPKTMNYSRDREVGRAYSLQLAHTVGCNSLLTTLVHHSRQPNTTGTLTAWWSAARCGRHWGDIITPDGYGRWREAGRDVEWFIEFDFGTEQLSRLAAKLIRYEQLASATGITTPILLWLPTPEREATVRQVLAKTLQSLDHPRRVPVATTNAAAATNPVDMTEPRWRRIGDADSAGRTRLVDLPSLWPDLAEPQPHAPGDGRTRQTVDERPDPAPPRPTPPFGPTDYGR
ncbi:replication-relaxation family protein [Amycolatopsis sp. H20-H5]|uniref:replication-relaxation family protein n=1 Tax=Amycolatopsis sp. H20-H5 TaxID=3046309 RepID=UPI002DBD917C|nr:replication-relaxation family protein [Amycolatopsis sp. H20-H5]MEC3974343.1 replication-relaxation family protein [Amycolatopsis sp. H20-H5]